MMYKKLTVMVLMLKKRVLGQLFQVCRRSIWSLSKLNNFTCLTLPRESKSVQYHVTTKTYSPFIKTLFKTDLSHMHMT